MSSMLLFLHRLRFEVVGIGVNQYQPRNLVHVQVRKRAHVVAAEGGSHQNVGPGDAGMCSAVRSSSAMRTLVRGMGPGSLNPVPARS